MNNKIMSTIFTDYVASELYNEELVFPGNDMRMGCVIREPIKRGVSNDVIVYLCVT